MTESWQLTIVLAAVAWAVLVVVRRLREAVSGRRAGCGSTACGGCEQRLASPLVTLSVLPDQLADR